MVMDLVGNSSISALVDAIIEIVVASNDVLVEKKSFIEFSLYLDKIIPLLRELSKKDIGNSESLRNFLEVLSHQTKDAKKLIEDCSGKNRLYLFVNCRWILKQIKHITKEISRAMSCIPFATVSISLKIQEDINQLISKMQAAEFRTAVAAEEILQKMELGIQERNVDRSYANNLLVLIANVVGVSTDRSTLRKEFDEFKNEIQNLRLRKDKAETIQMDQIIALLERSDVASSLEDREKKYLSMRRSLGEQPLDPLLSFYCPITKEVMVDPVETPSGHTFERHAIEKWLSEATDPLCPLTSNPLTTSMLRPNRTLRQSIEEWKERNTMILIASLKLKLSSENEEDVLLCLEQLKDLCEQKEIHKEWLILENYLPSLVELLHVKNKDIKCQALRVLHLLAKHNDDAREQIATIKNSVEQIVKLLGRSIGERKLAVALLLELSECELIRDCIAKIQGCILLLVTTLNNTDHQAASDVRSILDNLSYCEENVILMAKNNYFKYLLERLSSSTESDDVKLTMTKVLGEMELTDHNKSSLVESGVLDLLLHLISHDDVEMKVVATRALLNLSSLKKNGQEIIKKGAVRVFLSILYCQTTSQSLRELIAAIIVNLALSTIPEGCDLTPISMVESDEDISELFSLINLTGPSLQQNILKALYAMCLSPSADVVKSKLKECSAVQELLRLCESDNITLRANSVKLLHCLVEDGDETAIVEHATQTSVEILLKIIKDSRDDEEISSALVIIANLPKSTEISQWLVGTRNLPAIFHFVVDGKNIIHQKHKLIEDAVGAVCRLTIKTHLHLQKKVAEAGIIPLLVQLLEVGSSITIRRAAICLSQLSESSPMLTRQIPQHPKFWCFSSSPEAACPVHQGLCTMESSFCLIEAGAVSPLIQVLNNPDSAVCEAGLDALLSLIDGQQLQNGCKVLDEENAIPNIIRLISSPSPKVQEKVLNSLERIFRLVEYKQRYGSRAHMPLVDLTQRGNSMLKSLAAKILAQLSVIHDQSSYF